MTLYVNARFLTQPVSGVQRYAHELLAAFDRLLMHDPGLSQALGPVVALAPQGAVAPPGWQAIKLCCLPGGKGHVWEQTRLAHAARDGILLSLGNSGPLIHPAHVLALHDANIYDTPSAFRARYRLLHKVLRPRLARRAAALITVSQYSAGALARHLGVAEDRFAIVPNGADHVTRWQADPEALTRHGLVPGGYLLSVGNQSPNKNIARLIAAHGAAGDAVPPLVVVGGTAAGVTGAALDGSGRVRPVGRVSDAMLRALYEGAAGFVFPSLFEGFGIPPLEAMGLGVPVLAARGSAMPEVLGDAALWFDPLDVDDMARALRAFAAMPPAARADLVARGRSRAAGFTWAASAGALGQVLRAVSQADRSGIGHTPARPAIAVVPR